MREELGNADRARPAHPREIVPQQVHDHHILRPVFFTLGQGTAERGIMHRPQSAGPGSLDGPSLDAPAVLVQAEETLRRGAEDRNLVESQIGGKRSGVQVPESLVELERSLV